MYPTFLAKLGMERGKGNNGEGEAVGQAMGMRGRVGEKREEGRLSEDKGRTGKAKRGLGKDKGTGKHAMLEICM